MGRGRKGDGVELRANDIRVRFTWQGERRYEVLPLKPTLANERYAKRLMVNVKHALDSGTFVYASFFPESDAACGLADNRFGAFADLWLASKGGPPTLEQLDTSRPGPQKKLAIATRGQYDLAIKQWKQRRLNGRALADWPMDQIRHSQIAALIGSVAWPSARMMNNSLIPLRGIFEMWVADDRRNRVNPLEGVENAAFQKGAPDPFTEEETELIVERLYKKFDVLIGAYFETAFFTGARPQEEIALHTAKVDWRDRLARIDLTRTYKGHEKATKTYEMRDHELSKRAIRGLQMAHAMTKDRPHGHILANPVTGRPWHDERSQREHYWYPVLAELGIRARRPYCTRHTYITLALSRGCNPGWVARQSGHKNTKMLWDVYSKWIDKADKGREVGKFDAGDEVPE